MRHGDSLSPILFSLIMDKIISSLPRQLGYSMEGTQTQAICYADDAVLLADSEENLQNILMKFEQSAKKLNMEISLKKTKCLSTSKANQKCEIKLGDTILEQVAKFNYLGVEISSNGNLREEVKTQVTKGTRISGCLNNLIWRNRYMSAESRVRIYKTSVRPVLTYAAESRADTISTQQLLKKTEIRIIRTIQEKTLRDRVRS